MALTFACGPDSSGVETAIAAFADAVQREDPKALGCLSADGSAEGALAAALSAYSAGRDAGRVELDRQGMALVKLLNLGRGTFTAPVGRPSSGTDGVVTRMEVRLGYAGMDLSGFPPGTTFYVCGEPVGVVQPVEIPAGSAEVRVVALETVVLEWTLVRVAASPGCPAGWAVAAVRPLPETARSAEVRWEFR
jgi:hypothetical protein